MRSQRLLTSGREPFRAKIQYVVGRFRCSRPSGSVRKQKKIFRIPLKTGNVLTFSDSKRQKIKSKSLSTVGVRSSSVLTPRRSESALKLLYQKTLTMLGSPRCPARQRPARFAAHNNPGTTSSGVGMMANSRHI